MGIEFARSSRSTIGIEWELALVDRESGDLVCLADEVLAALRGTDGAPHLHITGELLLNTVELVSGVHHTVGGAVADVAAQVEEVRAITDPRGVDLICSGSHPFGQWFDQEVTDKARYHRLIERTQWWGRNMMIWGIHVHVGIEDKAKVIPILNGLLGYLPHLQALSASSPYWAGVNTGYASNRALMFQQLPTAGLPWILEDWEAWEHYVEDMTATGVIEDVTEVRWDIRPSPRWGTIEVRACDGVSTTEELGAIAAFIQCLVEWMSTRLDDGEEVPSMQPWFVRENKWRAARYGLDAQIIMDAAGQECPVVDDVHRLIGALSPVAERLGCLDELLGLGRIISGGASYQRQLRIADDNDGDLPAVVKALSRELRTGLSGDR
ncbi:glutamate--cysteine ligase [Cryobacterium sp. TMT1-21]|uniref:Putative glutamate--cysteine ligase 2 n=1 Tax=Cryobacterium shii TaxID=1259235 RepID=A0AAQ2HGS5_9MICO|nr:MULTISPECIES: glutamate--cysteine ligase [Cryobacterium]TFC52355.1 glutamate--cysteine ligase [Cryobacterium shii]TFC87529.1 glutamate--cysteine ligase [Cryobacterium sp. TmT2-59]TFD10877.1 glutamate--cysteine ligase [Cryobacterium sp. TMT1-21]TFD16516.1 glutamate--cysteine ligase [Cryobacterium sp. TMT2-23]TFD20484.1 glutamate--cysteine ligase [Cryobacterium sp. TMT4-10]